jgi:hypothetical protein
MESTEQESTNTLQAGVRLDPEIFAIIDRFRTEEDRSMSKMIAILLKSHPRVQEALESESAIAA